MKILGVIPARFASTRFPGKPLAEIAGKTMIERVCFQASQAGLSRVIVATDDARIADHVEQFGGEAVMTSKDHASGTDRCAEALQKSNEEYDAVINIQGDEPFIQPAQIRLVATLLEGGAPIATLIKKIKSREELDNPNTPKVVISADGAAIYFSRHPIPFLKDALLSDMLQLHTFFKHIGIYGYSSQVLKEITKLKSGLLEKAESLEQLRWLEHGYRIMTAETDQETIAVDTLADLDRIQLQYFNGNV